MKRMNVLLPYQGNGVQKAGFKCKNLFCKAPSTMTFQDETLGGVPALGL